MGLEGSMGLKALEGFQEFEGVVERVTGLQELKRSRTLMQFEGVVGG